MDLPFKRSVKKRKLDKRHSDYLEMVYLEGGKIKKELLDAISKSIETDVITIRNWFNNRKTKEKKNRLKELELFTKDNNENKSNNIKDLLGRESMFHKSNNIFINNIKSIIYDNLNRKLKNEILIKESVLIENEILMRNNILMENDDNIIMGNNNILIGNNTLIDHHHNHDLRCNSLKHNIIRKNYMKQGDDNDDEKEANIITCSGRKKNSNQGDNGTIELTKRKHGIGNAGNTENIGNNSNTIRWTGRDNITKQGARDSGDGNDLECNSQDHGVITEAINQDIRCSMNRPTTKKGVNALDSILGPDLRSGTMTQGVVPFENINDRDPMNTNSQKNTFNQLRRFKGSPSIKEQQEGCDRNNNNLNSSKRKQGRNNNNKGIDKERIMGLGKENKLIERHRVFNINTKRFEKRMIIYMNAYCKPIGKSYIEENNNNHEMILFFKKYIEKVK
eukprot:GHVP01036654.1.p1 GENE.GHVP01036654.1~~GHVP01036654.1.p1  ORF type:complete len:449 (+),score=72.49 GHVP01036654.1:626-1972(+)